jgi:2-methylcitrate dehydratase PrpD
VVEDAKRIIADTIACAIAAGSFDAGKLIVESARALGSAPAESTIFAGGAKVSAAASAFANSYLANLLDADETLLNSTHHACCTVFPALALCESHALSGRELITAVATGYDVGARVGLSLTIARVNERGEVQRIPSAGLGWATFGAAAAGGKALGLSAGQLAHALGIAGWVSPISSHRKWDETENLHMMKNSPHAFMGMHGVIAAQMAHRGFSADSTIFDGDAGYWTLAGSPDSHWDVLTGELGKKWWISEAAIKPYALNRLTHHSIDAFRKLIEDHELTPEDIDAVHVKTFARVASPFLSGKSAPQTAIAAQFSLPYALAACAYGFELTPAWQRPRVLNDPRLSAFMSKITVDTDADIKKLMADDFMRTRRYPRVPAEVTVIAKSGTHTARTEYAWGDPGSPKTRFTDEQLKHKFFSFTEDVLLPAGSDAAFEALSSLEGIGNVATGLTPLLCHR